MKIDPKEIPVPKLHAHLLSSVAPRPIAFASTIDSEGNVNLSPFSFFNVFSSNPPTLIFSPARRGRDNTTKHTYQNVKEIPEVVINIVNYSMVQQASLASCEFPKGINEFEKAGFTELPSERVKPPRVAESPVSFECSVNQVIELGTQGGAGNLVICEVLLMHVRDEVLDDQGRIDPFKLDAVARMGQDYYCRANGESVFVVPKPNEKQGIGFDQIPEWIRQIPLFTKNDLGKLANIERIPERPTLVESSGKEVALQKAKKLIDNNNIEEAWRVLLASQPSTK